MLRQAWGGVAVRVAGWCGGGPWSVSRVGMGGARGVAKAAVAERAQGGWSRPRAEKPKLRGGRREWMEIVRPERQPVAGKGAGARAGQGQGQGQQGKGQQGKGQGQRGPKKWDRGAVKGGFNPRKEPIQMMGKGQWPVGIDKGKGWTARDVLEAARRRVVPEGSKESGWLMRQRRWKRPVFESPRMVRDLLFLKRHGFDKVARAPGYVYYSQSDWRRAGRRWKEKVHAQRVALQPKLPEGYEYVPGTQNTVMQPLGKGVKELQPHLHFSREKWPLLGPMRRAVVLRAHRVLRKLRRRTWLKDEKMRKLRVYDKIVEARARAKNEGKRLGQPVSDAIAAQADQLRRGLQQGSIAVPQTKMDTASQLEDRSKLGWRRGAKGTDDALLRSAAIVRHGKQKGVDALMLPFSSEFLAQVRDPFYPERLPWQMNRREWEVASPEERRHGVMPPTELVARTMSPVHYNASGVRKVNSAAAAGPYRLHPDDTGGTAVQVVRLTERLAALDAHLARGRNHDKNATRDRILVFNRRQRLLKYLLTRCGKKGRDQHAELLKRYGIVHHHDLKHTHLGQITWVKSDPRGKPQTEERLVRQALLRRHRAEKRERLMRQRGKKTRVGLKIKRRSEAVRQRATASGESQFLRQQGVSPRQQLRIDAAEARQSRGRKK